MGTPTAQPRGQALNLLVLVTHPGSPALRPLGFTDHPRQQDPTFLITVPRGPTNRDLPPAAKRKRLESTWRTAVLLPEAR